MSARVEKIVAFLAHSEVVRHHATGGGFFIPRGVMVQLEDGPVLEAIEWLSSEGIVSGISAAGYQVSYNPAGDYFERLSFFPQKVHAVPFALEDQVPNIPTIDPEMPF